MSEEIHDNDYKAANRCQDVPFGCSACHSLLGYVDKATKTKIRVKYRDLYIRVTDAKVIEITCRSCGELNQLTAIE